VILPHTSVSPHHMYLVVHLQQLLVVSDVLHLVQEPAVDLGELVQPVHRVAGSEGRRQNKDALVCRNLQLLVSRGMVWCYIFTMVVLVVCKHRV